MSYKIIITEDTSSHDSSNEVYTMTFTPPLKYVHEVTLKSVGLNAGSSSRKFYLHVHEISMRQQSKFIASTNPNINKDVITVILNDLAILHLII